MKIWFKGREFDTDDKYNYEYYISGSRFKWNYYLRVDRLNDQIRFFEEPGKEINQTGEDWNISYLSEQNMKDGQWKRVSLEEAIKYANS